MEQDLGLLSYGKQFITLKEYSQETEKKNKFDIYRDVIYDLEDTKSDEEAPFYQAWLHFA